MELLDILCNYDSVIMLLGVAGLLFGFRSLPSTLSQLRDFIKEIRDALNK